MIEHHQHAEFRCRICNYKLDASTSVTGEAAPGNGDFSICLRCGEISIFEATANGLVTGLREPNFVELELVYRHHRDMLARFTRLRARMRMP